MKFKNFFTFVFSLILVFSLSVVTVVAEDIDDVNETEEILIYSDEDTLVYATVNVEDLENFDVETAYQEFSESYNEESKVKTYGYAPGQPSNPSPDRRLMFILVTKERSD